MLAQRRSASQRSVDKGSCIVAPAQRDLDQRGPGRRPAREEVEVVRQDQGLLVRGQCGDESHPAPSFQERIHHPRSSGQHWA
jgi:hypothetical protein